MVAAVAAAQGIPWATGHSLHTPSFKLTVTKQLPAQRAEGRQVIQKHPNMLREISQPAVKVTDCPQKTLVLESLPTHYNTSFGSIKTGLTGSRASAGQPSPLPTLAAPFSQGTLKQQSLHQAEDL